jgi:endonuclease-8
VPEGHTIHRLARDLRTSLADQPVAASSPQVRFAEGAALLDGARLVRAEAWGKYLFCDFGVGEVLHVHLVGVPAGRSGSARPDGPDGRMGRWCGRGDSNPHTLSGTGT